MLFIVAVWGIFLYAPIYTNHNVWLKLAMSKVSSVTETVVIKEKLCSNKQVLNCNDNERQTDLQTMWGQPSVLST
jgi:hypothetical protein